MLLSIRNVKLITKMRWFTMFITAVCVLFLIILRRPKEKSLYDLVTLLWGFVSGSDKFLNRDSHLTRYQYSFVAVQISPQ